MAKKDWHHLYDTAQWKRMRLERLCVEPTCRLCREAKRITAATVADHIVPHKGDEELFFDFDNTQSLCKTCHDVTKKRAEARGHTQGCDVNGSPLSAGHHWNAA